MGLTVGLSRVPVLLVEDNPVDARMVKLALDKVKGWQVQISVVEDGDQAFDYLQQIGEYVTATMPEVVVLDLNLPKRNGTEVLKLIRHSRALQHLRVVVLSSSPLDVIEDQVRGSGAEPDCCFSKPLDLDQFLAIGTAIRNCYLTGGSCP